MSASTVSFEEGLHQVSSGEELTEESASAIARADGSSLKDLCDAAAHLRDVGKGNTVTFSPKVFIPLTRLCPSQLIHHCVKKW